MAMYSAEYLRAHLQSELCEINGVWHPVRPINYRVDSWWHRVKLAWAVLTGKMDAVRWYKQ